MNMRKYWLIIKKEYLERVKKWSFILTTLLAPLFFIGIIALQLFFVSYSSSEEKYIVLDESELDWEILKSNKAINLSFDYSKDTYEKLKLTYKKDKYAGIIYIPKLNSEEPTGIEIFADDLLSIRSKLFIENELENALKNLRYQQLGISENMLNKLKKKITIKQIGLGENKSGNTVVATIIGYISGFIIYFVLIFYGMMVMRGVADEKNNRIVEVMLSTVKPIELMIGKIVGIGLVGLTQFLMWICLILIGISVVGIFVSPDLSALVDLENMAEMQAANVNIDENMALYLNSIKSINFTPLIIGFILFFIGGYFFYAALYAIMGVAMGDNNEQSQSLNIIITTPLIIAVFAVTAIINQPNSAIAIWSSFIPFFSPITMPVRLAFGVPIWQTVLSIVILFGSFILATALAAKIYKTGILMYGKKISLKEIWKWARY